MSLSRRRKIKPYREHDPDAVSPLPFAGLILMASSFFLYGASGLLAPWWVVVLLMVWWVLLLGLCLSWFTRRPAGVLWIGVVSLAVWFPIMLAGGLWLGWNA